jgi:hypothetical protein
MGQTSEDKIAVIEPGSDEDNGESSRYVATGSATMLQETAKYFGDVLFH